MTAGWQDSAHRYPRRMTTRLLAWIALIWNVITILLGALVRATGSGAGCGASWPTCDGVIVPELSGARAIEFSHRAATGVALVLIGWLLIRVFRTEAKGAPIRKSAGLSGFGVLSESLIGAFIVLFELVEFDDSIARSVSVPIHLVNTLVLLAGLTLTVFWSTEEEVATVESPHRRALIGFGLGMVAIAATGAVAALADTLFPPDSLSSGIAAELDGESELLTSLKVLHPLFAIAIGIGAVRWIRSHAWDLSGSGRLAARIGVFTVGLQLFVGVVNVSLLTPIVIQLIHLLLADVLWISWVWLAAALTTAPVRSSALA